MGKKTYYIQAFAKFAHQKIYTQFTARLRLPHWHCTSGAESRLRLAFCTIDFLILVKVQGGAVAYRLYWFGHTLTVLIAAVIFSLQFAESWPDFVNLVRGKKTTFETDFRHLNITFWTPNFGKWLCIHFSMRNQKKKNFSIFFQMLFVMANTATLKSPLIDRLGL